MANPSPNVTVQDGGGSPVAPSGFVDITVGHTITIALVSSAGVKSWSISCVGTDELNSVASINAGIVVNSPAFSAAFTAPAAGSALVMRSAVTGFDNATFSTTFKLTTPTSSGLRVGAVGEQLEHDPTYGSLAITNQPIRQVDGLLSGQSSSAVVTTTVAIGDVLCSANDATGASKLTKATPTALAAGGEVVGYALQAGSSGATILIAGVGTVVDTTISGLSSGASSVQDAVVTTSAGTARSTGVYNGGEWIIGRANKQGQVRVAPHIVKGRPDANVRHPQWSGGAQGDVKELTGTFTSGSTTATISGLTTADIGKVLVAVGAGAVIDAGAPSTSAGGDLCTTITNVSGTTITLAAAAGSGMTGGRTLSSPIVSVGTDDTTAMQAAIDAVNTAGGGIVHFPVGRYMTTGLTFYSKVTLDGGTKGNLGGAEIYMCPPVGGTVASKCLQAHSLASIVRDVHIRHLTFTLYRTWGQSGTTAVSFEGVSNSSVEHCTFRYFERAIYGHDPGTGGGYYNTYFDLETVNRIGYKLDNVANSNLILSGRTFGAGHAYPVRRNQLYPDSTTYALTVNYVVPFTSGKSGYFYEALVSGTTGATEPTWPTVQDQTVVDGTVTWICRGATYEGSMSSTVQALTQTQGIVSVGGWCHANSNTRFDNCSFEKNSVGVYVDGSAATCKTDGCRFEQSYVGAKIIEAGAFYGFSSGNDYADGQGAFLVIGDNEIDLDGRNMDLQPNSTMSSPKFGAPRNLFAGQGVPELTTALGLPQGWLSSAGSMGGTVATIQTAATPQDHTPHTDARVLKFDLTACVGTRDFYLLSKVQAGQRYSVTVWTYMDCPAVLARDGSQNFYAAPFNIRIDDSSNGTPGTTLYSSSLQITGAAQPHNAHGIVSTTGWMRLIVHLAANATNTTVYDGTHQVRNARLYLALAGNQAGLFGTVPVDDDLAGSPVGLGAQLDCTSGTIAPTRKIHHVIGTGPLATITPPFTAWAGGPLILIAGDQWTTATTGNISNFVAPKVGDAVVFVYDTITSKWYANSRVNNQGAIIDLNGNTTADLGGASPFSGVITNPVHELTNGSASASTIQRITPTDASQTEVIFLVKTPTGTIATVTGGNIRKAASLVNGDLVRFVKNPNDSFWYFK